MKEYHQLYSIILGCRREIVCLVENKIMRMENTKKNKKKKEQNKFFRVVEEYVADSWERIENV